MRQQQRKIKLSVFMFSIIVSLSYSTKIYFTNYQRTHCELKFFHSYSEESSCHHLVSDKFYIK